MAVRGQRFGERGHRTRGRAVARQDVVVAEDGQRRQRGGAGQRIAGVAVRMQEGAFARIVQEAVVDRLRGQHRRQRHETTGQALRQAQQVRHHPALLAGEQRAGTAETHRDLVGDQERAAGVAELAHAGQVVRMMHAHATGALHARLDDHRADLAGVTVEQCGQRIGGARGAFGRGFARLRQVGIGRRREQRFGQQRRIHTPVQGDVAHRERPERFAVVAVLQRDELRPTVFAAVVEPVESHLQCHFHTGRAVVGVEHLGQRRATGLPRRDRQQALGQFDRGGVGEAGQHHLFQCPGLRGDGGADAWLGMAEQVGPPAADRVQVARAVMADQPGAFAAGDRHQRQGVRVLTHLGAGMPQHRQVAVTPIVRLC